MKKLLLIFVLAGLLLPLACKKTTVHTTRVVRNCTGTYLECAGKHYRVCNHEMLEPYADGAKIKASFKKVHHCQSTNRAECVDAHADEGWIEILKIK